LASGSRAGLLLSAVMTSEEASEWELEMEAKELRFAGRLSRLDALGLPVLGVSAERACRDMDELLVEDIGVSHVSAIESWRLLGEEELQMDVSWDWLLSQLIEVGLLSRKSNETFLSDWRLRLLSKPMAVG
jgi:hypothetical protein